MPKNKNRSMNVRDIKGTLDSDDEFPDDHNDPCAIPDYLNEWRFESIQFKWINKSSTHNTEAKQKQCQRNSEEITRPNKCIIINRGIMNRQDLYCLKIIAKACPSILIWFANFTLYKDLQSPYKFLHSCLAIRY